MQQDNASLCSVLSEKIWTPYVNSSIETRLAILNFFERNDPLKKCRTLLGFYYPIFQNYSAIESASSPYLPRAQTNCSIITTQQYGGGKPMGPGSGPGAVGAGTAGAPRRHPDFAKAEGYLGGGAAGGAGGAPAGQPGARFGGAWGAGFPRAPQPPAPAQPWRPPPPQQPPGAWPHQPYQQVPTKWHPSVNLPWL